ncbi:MAG: radical SAM family heme chaperone HemW [Verrucomicrobiales bacterium]|nr:radical SAM family heme chaperone HemW [Verrucomicrobiales bacterium]
MPPIPHVYLHIPFCHRICPYCSFYKHQPGGTDIPAFLEAVIQETKLAATKWGERLAVETIYWGGGTPSMLSTKHLENFLPKFLNALGNPTPVEWSVEMNPRSLTPDKLSLLRSCGVTRASLGVQAWDAATLKTLGRDHTPAEAAESFAALRRASFPVVSMDLMFSIPNQPLDLWMDSLRQTVALRPDHISCYNLTYEEDTQFFERFRSGEYSRDENADETFFTRTEQFLEAAGFLHYETSNYAQPGCQSRHNSGYWRGADYLGLGPSAVSTIDRIRTKNVEDTGKYIRLLDNGAPPAGEIEHLTPQQWICERLALELRTAEGVDLSILESTDPSKLEQLEMGGLAKLQDRKLALINRGKLLVDSIVEFLWT